MLITKVSSITGISHSREINVTESQIQDWKNGQLIQIAMANVPMEDREFIKSGITPEEWNEFIVSDDIDI